MRCRTRHSSEGEPLNATSGSCSSSEPIAAQLDGPAEVGRESPRVQLHHLHDVGVALTPEADEVVVLGKHIAEPVEKLSVKSVGLPEVVLVEDEVIAQILWLTEYGPPHTRIHQAELTRTR